MFVGFVVSRRGDIGNGTTDCIRIPCVVECEAQVASEGTLASLLHALTQHPQDRQLCCDACSAVGALCANTGTHLPHTSNSTAQCDSPDVGGVAAHRLQVSELGGAQVLVDTLRRHASDAKVVDAACFALGNLAAQCSTCCCVLW